MRVLHVAVHLGGGIGKAHAAMAPHMPRDIERIFVLLEPPKDKRYIETIKAGGAEVFYIGDRDGKFPHCNVLQLEYWGHQKLKWYSITDGPTIVWAHRSGIGETKLPSDLSIDHLVLSSPVSIPHTSFAMSRVSVINSGFGFSAEWCDRGCGVCYLGTVDFKKMHLEFFHAIDSMSYVNDPVMVWGEPSPEVEYAARCMKRPARVALRGHADDPQLALSRSGIFFYPLRRDHYGTGENALVEAMSMGLVPIVLDNPAESSIVPPDCGFVCKTIAECVEWVEVLVRNPSLRLKMSEQAARYAKEKFSAAESALRFVDLWTRLVAKKKELVRA